MQLQLPFFPEGTKPVNSTLGCFEKDGYVYYLHNGSPVYCHRNDDRNSYRFILGNLVCNKLCTVTELHQALGEARKNIERYARTFREKGAEHFFSRRETRGQCYKMTKELLSNIQEDLDAGCSQYSLSKKYDISEAAIRYHIKNGNLNLQKKTASRGSQPLERNLEYLSTGETTGMAATRVSERVCRAFGLVPLNPVRFETCYSVPNGGVMLLLPFLMECGLLSYRSYHDERNGYYTFESLLITLSFLLLLRIKTVEGSKLYNPGETGKLIGYDRIPEVKKLRGMIGELTRFGKCEDWGKSLAMQWMKSEEPELYYVDGHVQVYYGSLAELGKKHVSRQRLCLPGMMEFWVNSPEGLPFFFITAEVNEKMIEMLETEIIPRLLELHAVSEEQKKKMEENADYPLFTLVFDREAYSPAFFKRLWETRRIAVLTCRKNVKDCREEAEFEEVKVDVRPGETVMQLKEKEITLDGYSMREVRRLTPSGHQTGIITNNRILSIALIASYMFGRWVQENFFRYLRQDYAFDRIIQYAVDEVDKTVMVVNREYSNIQYDIKRLREKLCRLKAKMYKLQQNALKENEEKKADKKEGDKLKKEGSWFNKVLELTEKAQLIETEMAQLIAKRKTVSYKIPVGQMPENERYVKLHQESKYFMNIIKMICYRAETALANRLAPHYCRAEDEVRALVKAITRLSIDIMPDEKQSLLNITLYPLSNPRSQQALSKIIDDINATDTLYPGTVLKMKFKIATVPIAPSQEF